MKKVPKLLPADIVIFGGRGNLSQNKIIPALYHRFRDEQLPKQSRIITVDSAKLSLGRYLSQTENNCRKAIKKKDFTKTSWAEFARKIDYISIDAEDVGSYGALSEILAKQPRKVRIFYLATPSDIFSTICYHLKATGLITEDSRVVLEKPLGLGLASFKKINQEVLECFSEKQIYRIDHYLGKETVQNLMILRFANNLFERIWNSDSIDHIQITVYETLGVEGREEYYDKFGALRDMVQNHLLQLLCLVAMEPPSKLTADTVRDEKLKVLKSLRQITPENIKHNTVRGQYTSYASEVNKKNTVTETFVAIKAEIDSWRWSGVPFYLRTGKKLSKRYSEIVLEFQKAPVHIFPTIEENHEPNKFIIRLQPDESVKLQMITKVPGPGGYRLKPVNLNLSLTEEFTERYPDAYERLLMDVVRGNQTLFMRSDEVEAAWIWTENILESWKKARQQVKPYKTGSNGPTDVFSLIERDNRKWHETGN